MVASAAQNTQIPRVIEWLIDNIAHTKDEKECGLEIMKSLPLAVFNQHRIIQDLVPTKPYAYWRILKRMVDMEMLKKDRTFLIDGTRGRSITAYVLDKDFLEKIGALQRAWVRYGNFGKVKDESASQS